MKQAPMVKPILNSALDTGAETLVKLILNVFDQLEGLRK